MRDTLVITGATDPGCVRKNNEDNFAVDARLGLIVVADGMGGHNSGEVASDIATKTIVEFARKINASNPPFLPRGGSPGLSPRGRQLEFCVQSANEVIFRKGQAFPKDSGMGTTVVAAIIDSSSVTVAHVGDSRLYLHRQEELSQLTQDHSLVGEQVRRGQISMEDASRSNLQNILTRALGSEGVVQVDVTDHQLLPGDIVLVATDGLSKMVSDQEISRTISALREPQLIVEALILKTRAAGGVDNVTVVAAGLSGRREGRVRGFVSRLFKR